MNVPLMIDAVLVLLLVLGLVLGWRRGLFKSVMRLAAVLLAFLLAGAAAQYATDWAVKRLSPAVEQLVEKEVESIVTEAADQLGQSLDEALTQVVEHIPVDYLRREMAQLLDSGTLPEVEDLSDLTQAVTESAVALALQVLESSLRGLLYTVFYLICFIVLVIVFNLIIRLLNLTFHLPILRGLNAFGGAVFGLAEVGVLMMVLLPLLATFADGWLQEGLRQSFLTQKLLQTDLPSIFQSVNGG